MSENNMDIMMEPISKNFPQGMEELAELLTFLPEEMRLDTTKAMIGAFLQF